MDPNAGKKDMFNKLGRGQLIENLNQENFIRKTTSFYRYVIIENPEKMRDKLYKEWKELNVFGRIYLAKEGINAQLSLPENNWDKFVKQLNIYSEFKNIPFKIAVEDNGKSFFKLTIKVRNQIVADGLSIDDYDVTNAGEHLTNYPYDVSRPTNNNFIKQKHYMTPIKSRDRKQVHKGKH